MSKNERVAVSDLTLDLKNFRTVHQLTEAAATEALIQINPEKFWGLMESIVTDGYLPTENIIVLKKASGDKEVREGNRRVAILKLLLGLTAQTGLSIPAPAKKWIADVSAQFKKDNRTVPCVVYEVSESVIVEKIVSLTHGKGERASRSTWSAVAKARFGRDVGGNAEPGLDLLEKYIKQGKNITLKYAERWAGEYPITVLNEALKTITPLLGFAKPVDLVTAYPNVNHRDELEEILTDIGMGTLNFAGIRRNHSEFATKKYGLPATAPPPTPPIPTAPTAAGTGNTGNSGGTASGNSTGALAPVTVPVKVPATGIDTEATVMRALKGFKPQSTNTNRAKVVTLRDECLHLNLLENRIAFCLLLRSMFEISAKAYCDDLAGTPSAIATKDNNGNDRKLVDLLRDITNQMTALPNNKQDKAKQKLLHGAMAEMAKHDSLLSVTSMNNLVHSPTFMLSTTDICITFANIFPLLQEMNV